MVQVLKVGDEGRWNVKLFFEGGVSEGGKCGGVVLG